MALHPSELDFRRRWYLAHLRRFEADTEAVRAAEEAYAGFDRSAAEALGHVETLRRTGDPEAFRAAMQAWANKPDTLAFNGTIGQMLFNQLVKLSDDPYRLGSLLADCLTAPSDEDSAADARARRTGSPSRRRAQCATSPISRGRAGAAGRAQVNRHPGGPANGSAVR